MATLPYDFHYEDKMTYRSIPQASMYGYVDIHITEDKKKKKIVGKISVKFSNGQQIDGGDFNVEIKFLNRTKKVLASVGWQKRLGPAGFHGAVERTGSLALPDIDYAKLTTTKVRYWISAPQSPLAEHPVPVTFPWNRI